MESIDRVFKKAIRKDYMISNLTSILQENGVYEDLSDKIGTYLWNEVYYRVMDDIMFLIRSQLWVKMDNDEIL